MNKFYLLFFILFFTLNCSSDKNQKKDWKRPTAQDITVSWEVIANNLNGEARFKAAFTLENNSQFVLENKGWAMYFNQSNRRIFADSVQSIATVKQLGGDWYQLAPTEKFSLPPSEKVTIFYECSAWMIKESDGPVGLYFVFDDEKGEETIEVVENFTILPFERPEQTTRSDGDKVKVPTPESRYQENAKLSLLDSSQFSPIIPTPASLIREEGQWTLNADTRILFQEGLKNEANALSNGLTNHLKTEIKPQILKEDTELSAKDITLSLSSGPTGGGNEAESYALIIHPTGGVSLSANDPAGIFYGVQSLLALLPVETYMEKADSIHLAAMTIQDKPRFSYRGVHLDVSRNFQKKEKILKLLDYMAFYKLNKFHFHLTDDEGWRLEIPELPELTIVGAFRGHTFEEDQFLHPSYGSGPFPDATKSAGSGFYTKPDYLEILRYATERHIEVIPEIESPGHARAHIVAMKARYKRLMKTGRTEEAKAFLLHDPEDESEYKSVQDYDDNVMCVCQESTYRFLETVVASIVKMYDEAKAPLNNIHIGGDEVPAGVWEKSPACEKLIAQNAQLKSAADLPYYFFQRWYDILKKHNLNLAGWEEIAMKKVPAGNGQTKWIANPQFANQPFIPYVWQNLWGQEDLGYRLANAGYDVVLCNVTNLYFDMAYDKDPQEPGFYWGAFAGTRKAFEFVPLDMFKSTKVDPLGNRFDLKDFRKRGEQLQEDKMENIIGIQGQLWAETLHEEGRMEYLFFPKLLGLAERAWAQQPEWAMIEEDLEREEALNEAWNVFANALGQRELIRLNYLHGGVNYRIPPPGAIVENSLLKVNTAFPGLVVRMTEDGNEPDKDSRIYEKEIEVGGKVWLKTFDWEGRGSKVIEVQ